MENRIKEKVGSQSGNSENPRVKSARATEMSTTNNKAKSPTYLSEPTNRLSEQNLIVYSVDERRHLSRRSFNDLDETLPLQAGYTLSQILFKSIEIAGEKPPIIFEYKIGKPTVIEFSKAFLNVIEFRDGKPYSYTKKPHISLLDIYFNRNLPEEDACRWYTKRTECEVYNLHDDVLTLSGGDKIFEVIRDISKSVAKMEDIIKAANIVYFEISLDSIRSVSIQYTTKRGKTFRVDISQIKDWEDEDVMPYLTEIKDGECHD